MTQPADIARAVYQAYVAKDRSSAEALIAPDFHFTSPLDNRIDRAVYFARCWPNSEHFESFKLVHPVITDGNRVVVTYECTTLTGKRFRNTEVLTVRDGQLIEAEVYFGWNIPHKARTGGFVDE